MEKDKEDKKKEIKEWIVSFAIAIAAALFVRFFVFEMVVVQHSSMYPTLKENEKVGLYKLAYTFSEPEQGDIIVVKISEEKNYVKRLIATEGQSVKITDNTVYVDGEALSEEYIAEDLVYPDFDEITVPQGHIFVMGDNRPSSIDSRSLGCLEEDSIIGKVVIRFSPLTFF